METEGGPEDESSPHHRGRDAEDSIAAVATAVNSLKTKAIVMANKYRKKWRGRDTSSGYSLRSTPTRNVTPTTTPTSTSNSGSSTSSSSLSSKLALSSKRSSVDVEEGAWGEAEATTASLPPHEDTSSEPQKEKEKEKGEKEKDRSSVSPPALAAHSQKDASSSSAPTDSDSDAAAMTVKDSALEQTSGKATGKGSEEHQTATLTLGASGESWDPAVVQLLERYSEKLLALVSERTLT